MAEIWKDLSGYFGSCGWDVEHDFALRILPHMRADVLSRVRVVRWSDGYPVVHSTFKDLIGLSEYMADMYRYGFSILWNGK